MGKPGWTKNSRWLFSWKPVASNIFPITSQVGQVHASGTSGMISKIATGIASGFSSVLAIAGITTSTGVAAGSSTVQAFAATGTSTGAATGAGTASGIGQSKATATGTAAGTGAAFGIGPSTLNTTMTLVNTTGSIQASGFVTPIFGMTFKKGDIPSGTAPIFSVSSVPQPFSWGLQSYYGDGSLRHASFMFRCTSSVPANGTLSVAITNGGSAPSASSRTLTEVYAQNLKVVGVGVGAFGGVSGTYSGYLANDVNNVEQYVYMDGQAGKSWRILTHMASSAGAVATTTGSISGTTLTVSSGTGFAIGQQVVGPNIARATMITAGSGTSWTVSISQTAASGSVSVTNGHGQLEVYHYITALQDGSGNLGGFRHVGRITQPYYNADTPTKAQRGFTSVKTQYGAGPTTINIPWPYNNIAFNSSNGNNILTVQSAGTHNLYTGALSGSGANWVNVVPGYLTATTDTAFSTSQLYYAWTFGAPSNNTTFYLSTNNAGGSVFANGGTGTFVPIPFCLHGGSIYTSDSQGRSNFFQGTGSMTADGTIRTQFNRTYLHSTGAIPPWDLSLTGVAFGGTVKDIPSIVGSNAAAYWSGSPSWNNVSCGPISTAARGGTGDNLDIGVLTGWHAAHFYNQSSISDMVVRAIAYTSDFDGIGSVRDVTTGNYINVSNSNYTGMTPPSLNQQEGICIEVNICNGFTGPSTPPLGNMGFLWGGGQDTSHKPCMAFYAYLVFGEPHFYDLMIEAGTGGVLEMNPLLRVTSGTAPAGYGIIMAQSGANLRGKAWLLRDMMLAGHFAASSSPDGSLVGQYMQDLVTTNIAWCNALYSSTYLGTALNAVNSWRAISSTNANSDPNCGGFQMGYFICVMAWCAALGDSGALSWLNTYSTWPTYVVNNFGGYNLYAEYDGAVQMLGNVTVAGPIPTLNQYGIASGVYTALTWSPSSPAFSAPPGTGFGYTGPTNGDRWVFGPDMANNGVTQQDILTTGGVKFAYNTPYYVVNASGNNFDLATSPGGTAVPVTNSGNISQGTGTDGGYSYPWIILTNPPSAASGFCPSGTGFADAYVSIRRMGCDWVTAAGATGWTVPRNDAIQREGVNPPDNTIQANWCSQNSF